MTVTQPEQEITRDRYGRPLVTPEGGGKPVPYTRCTTFVDCLEDKFNLQKWMQRNVALGLADRPDLVMAVAAHRQDKRQLDKICADAQEAAKAHAAATTGTALHALTEQLDRGQDLGVVPEAYIADIAAYKAATEDLTATHIEQFCVLDALQIGGTPDRVVKYQGKRYIADIKTGSIEWGTLKIAMQLAVYARSNTYDIATRERGFHDAELDKGIIIHLPAGTGTCTLHWVDLFEGWNAVQIAKNVRAKRGLKFTDLTQPFGAVEAPPEPEPEPEVQADLPELIAACKSADAIRSLWALNSADWTPELTELAAARVKQIEAS